MQLLVSAKSFANKLNTSKILSNFLQHPALKVHQSSLPVDLVYFSQISGFTDRDEHNNLDIF